MKVVKFLVPAAPYNSGEQAGFDDATAKRLVDTGKAEYVKGAAARAPAKAEPEPPAQTRPDPAPKPEAQSAAVGDQLTQR